MTIVMLRRPPALAMVPRMTADTALLVRLLSLAALIAATTEYIEVIRRRVGRRAAARERATLQDHGLRGLVRVFLSD
jgi:hypothetical protein